MSIHDEDGEKRTRGFGWPGGRRKAPPGRAEPAGGMAGLLPQRWLSLVWYFLLAMGVLWMWQAATHQVATRTIPYSQFRDLLSQDRVASLTLSDAEIDGTVLSNSAPVTHSNQSASDAAPAPAASGSGGGIRTKSAASVSPESETNAPAGSGQSEKEASPKTEPVKYRFRTVRVRDPDLVRDLDKAGVEYAGVRSGPVSQLIWVWVLPIAAMVVLWQVLARRMGNVGQGLMSFGSTKAKVVADRNTGITFEDVAGCDEAKSELQEIIAFLKNPDRYKALGAAIPKGILLVGPPGTGKTLLSRAVAGEAKVPFFLLSGSDFVEMFVGVGAARVRDLFTKAKAQAPCIVFIDELDAVGRQRGVHMGPVNDEREQTLNALLVGMDGFETNLGVIILAATNRPEVLDRALLRPGRFDRQVVVDAPDLEGRLAILKLHVRNKPLAAEVELRKIAQQTPGLSGADLANIINEAALLAARHRARQIGQIDLEDAVDKVVAGPERKSRRLGDGEKRRVAYHEVGHALVSAYTQHDDAVHKITIVPHGHAALGYTMQLPGEEHYLMSRSMLLGRLRSQLGGRAAEEIVLGEVSTGAENDLRQATILARQMVAMYGMSEIVGLTHCAERQNPFAGHIPEGYLQRDCSEQTAREIDQEVKKMLSQAYAEAKAILREHRGKLDLIAGELLRRETMDGKTFQRLLQSNGHHTSGDGDSPRPEESLEAGAKVVTE